MSRTVMDLASRWVDAVPFVREMVAGMAEDGATSRTTSNVTCTLSTAPTYARRPCCVCGGYLHGGDAIVTVQVTKYRPTSSDRVRLDFPPCFRRISRGNFHARCVT